MQSEYAEPAVFQPVVPSGNMGTLMCQYKGFRLFSKSERQINGRPEQSEYKWGTNPFALSDARLVRHGKREFLTQKDSVHQCVQ